MVGSIGWGDLPVLGRLPIRPIVINALDITKLQFLKMPVILCTYRYHQTVCEMQMLFQNAAETTAIVFCVEEIHNVIVHYLPE